MVERMYDKSLDWRDRAIAHLKSCVSSSPTPDECCGNCYEAKPTTDGSLSCNSATSPFPQEIVEPNWWCFEHEARKKPA